MSSEYASLAREESPILSWLCDERHIAENTSCYIHVRDVQALWEEFRHNGLQIETPIVQPWQMKELFVIDPHGNLLKFGEDVAGSNGARDDRSGRD